MDREDIKRICREIKPYFFNKLGKYTHKRISDDWYFHGLGFVKDGMAYVFGMNLGFFRQEEPDGYDYLGMNVLVRLNGVDPALRRKFMKFFKLHLADWENQGEKQYTSERGGLGMEIARYKKLDDFTTSEQMHAFLKDCIDRLAGIYPIILQNPDGLFDDVLRASPQWDESLLDLVKEKLGHSPIVH